MHAGVYLWGSLKLKVLAATWIQQSLCEFAEANGLPPPPKHVPPCKSFSSGQSQSHCRSLYLSLYSCTAIYLYSTAFHFVSVSRKFLLNLLNPRALPRHPQNRSKFAMAGDELSPGLQEGKGSPREGGGCCAAACRLRDVHAVFTWPSATSLRRLCKPLSGCAAWAECLFKIFSACLSHPARQLLATRVEEIQARLKDHSEDIVGVDGHVSLCGANPKNVDWSELKPRHLATLLSLANNSAV